MLNFRKLKQDFSSTIIKNGKELYENSMVVSAKIISMGTETVKISGKVLGNFNNAYECEIEIGRLESEVLDSNCDCPYNYDCQHLTAMLFYLHDHFDKIVVEYSKEANFKEEDNIDDEGKKQLIETFKQSEGKQQKLDGKNFQREVLEEYNQASKIFWSSPFFLPKEQIVEDRAELAIVFDLQPQQSLNYNNAIEFHLALRLPNRSKPLHIPNIREFLEPIRYQEPLYLGGKRFFFSPRSFNEEGSELLCIIIDHVRYKHSNPDENDYNPRIAEIGNDAFGSILSQAHNWITMPSTTSECSSSPPTPHIPMPYIYDKNLENPLRFSPSPVGLHFELQLFQIPAQKILLKPLIALNNHTKIAPEEAHLFECANPGIIYKNTYYPFQQHIKRMHLQNLPTIRDMTIPEPLFGTFVENALPELQRFAKVSNLKLLNKFITIPFAGPLEARCDINYINNELEASLCFIYDNIEIHASQMHLTNKDITSFVTEHGILARDLAEERDIINNLFQDFTFEQKDGVYVTKSDKKVVEFMTEIIPRNQYRIEFHCPENLLEQFIYDDTSFTLSLTESEHINSYTINLDIQGDLSGVRIEQLWECLSSNKTYINLTRPRKQGKNNTGAEIPHTPQKILVLDLEKLRPIIELFDEIGIKRLGPIKQEHPLWSLVTIDPSHVETLPIDFTITDTLIEMREQMLGIKPITVSKIPKQINAVLRNYQKEGIHWLERLRNMHLNGILADDMGLGKTLQAIVAITQKKRDCPGSLSLVICPTSLTYNWKEEFSKFNKDIRAVVIDGTPEQRKKIMTQSKDYDVVITSYGLLQKDIEEYKKINFSYAILDEAQHIKNPETRNAKSVKMISADHRLILTGTPIENSIEELWSLFDFLMPGLFGSHNRFVERYLRQATPSDKKNTKLETLRKKVSPFMIRRMKKDVLSDLPPISEIVYHCQLSDTQRELYNSYANSAREELCKLVDKDGFRKVQIHILATLTRLKQICCHPAIFAKENVEKGDSAKYDMLFELFGSLIEGNHKTVVFSQYTRMLNIIKEDLKQRGIRFAYLDGSTKNRLDVVNKFNDDKTIPIFLVSLKAGGSGLNLVGADTVIHYDMWWNPAVENQATDRVHRIGQKNMVSSYKLVTLGTIEEKIVQLQNSKKELVKQIVSSDDETIAKLTWKEVLGLLQT